MPQTLVTKLKAIANNPNLPYFGLIKLKRDEGQTPTFTILTEWKAEITVKCLDGMIMRGSEGPFEEVTYAAPYGRAGFTFVGDATSVLVKAGMDKILGFDNISVPNASDLNNIPQFSTLVNGGISCSLKDFPATIKDIHLSLKAENLNKWKLSGDVSELKSTSLERFSSYIDNKDITGTVESLAEKFAVVNTVVIQNSKLTGNLSALFDKMSLSESADSTYIFKDTQIEGTLEGLAEALKGKRKNCRVSIDLRNSLCTYNGSPITKYYRIEYDVNGNYTIS